MISALIAQYLLPALAVIAGILGVWFTGRSVGKSKAEEKHAEQKAVEVKAIAAKQVETVKGATDVQNDVNKLGNGDALNELRDDWKR